MLTICRSSKMRICFPKAYKLGQNDSVEVDRMNRIFFFSIRARNIVWYVTAYISDAMGRNHIDFCYGGLF